jgi:cAMP phosphodiesterase
MRQEGETMKFRVLGCFGGQGPGFNLSSFLIEDRYLLDSGAASSTLSFEEQTKIDHILLTHAHLDHICGIFFLADNVFGQRQTPITIYSIPFVINSLKEHMFNNVIWPDFTQIPNADSPVLVLKVIGEGISYSIGDLSVTPIAVSHNVPSVGYLVRGSRGAILYTGDTGPTKKIWKVVASVKELRAIIVEISFPNRLQKIADLSGHLTPQGLQTEIAKAGHSFPPIFLTHLKPQFLEEITQELQSSPQIQILEQGKTYQF